MTEPKDVELMYFGYEYHNFDFINSQEVQDFLAKYDHLKMVMETFDPETDEEIIKEISLPFPEEDADGPIMLLDTRLDEADYEDHALLIHHQDDAFIMNPSPEFIEFLKMMQADFAKNGEEFFVKLLDQDDDEDEPEGEFDFDTFTYIKPAN
jgi:hypothetical protein